MNLQLPGPFRAKVPENISRPPAFEISAAPDAGLLELLNLQGAIDPAAASPLRRPHIPIGMIIEGNEDEWFGQSPNPKSAQMMKVAGTENEKRRQPWIELAKKFLDQARRRREPQARAPLARVDYRQIGRQIGPGIIEI